MGKKTPQPQGEQATASCEDPEGQAASLFNNKSRGHELGEGGFYRENSELDRQLHTQGPHLDSDSKEPGKNTEQLGEKTSTR